MDCWVIGVNQGPICPTLPQILSMGLKLIEEQILITPSLALSIQKGSESPWIRNHGASKTFSAKIPLLKWRIQ